MVEIEIANRSGVDVDEAAVRELVRDVLAREGVDAGEIGVAFVRPEEMRELKARAPRRRRGDRCPVVPDRRT